MKYRALAFLLVVLLTACSKEEATELERTTAGFIEDLNGEISPQQWWQTSVSIKINVVTDDLVKIWLLSSKNESILYDYREVKKSGTIVLTAPQGQEDNVTLTYKCDNIVSSIDIPLTGKSEESIYLDLKQKNKVKRLEAPAETLSGNSVIGTKDPAKRAQYYEFEMGQLFDFFSMMNISSINTDAKKLGLNCNYELISNGPFTITWVNGYKADQKSRILGYYFHTPGTYADIQYVDLSETHKWDYIDGKAKVQYKLSKDDTVDGHTFYANTWYDANFDLRDKYGATFSENMDRIGDNAYNMQEVFNRYQGYISGLRGISFDIDVPVGMHIGFFLRSDEEPNAEQWQRLQQMGVKPYTSRQYNFMGSCFSAEALNVDGTHRSFIMDNEEVIWMGMEDIVEGGDLDCNDVIFGVVTKLDINYMPDIIIPNFFSEDSYNVFPWTLAFEDVNREADFDFNDAVIKLTPDFENELCCVKVMAAGSTERMYLHYDGPDGDQNLGEIHELLGQRNKLEAINTTSSIISTPVVDVDCVPWPKGYTMANDAKRFYIEVKRGDCPDCSDIIALPVEPGLMPEALLVAGEWKWPKEKTHIFTAYPDFYKWAKDGSRTRFWEWYQSPSADSFVSY
ncbi:MAG: LruC domain-containing protein [Bacteroidaceae bacterium]|nr:LruC domain-containing protein [Bacteroidaceae bacterium]